VAIAQKHSRAGLAPLTKSDDFRVALVMLARTASDEPPAPPKAPLARHQSQQQFSGQQPPGTAAAGTDIGSGVGSGHKSAEVLWHKASVVRALGFGDLLLGAGSGEKRGPRGSGRDGTVAPESASAKVPSLIPGMEVVPESHGDGDADADKDPYPGSKWRYL
jgi:hypothetical protein